MKKICLVALLATAVSACARFQPTTPAAGMTQSITLKDSSIHYDPPVLEGGMRREQVLAAFGDPNSSRTTDNGVIEDVYAFNPDGSKFVDPQLRVRNVALGFFTMGTSVAVRQARLALTERKLTLFHVIYTSSDTIRSVTQERLAGAPDRLPAAPQPGGE